MEAKLRHHGEIAIVSINGRLDIERTQPFRDKCQQQAAGQKMIFNLQKANFVGSTGIQSFIDALKILASKSGSGLKLVGLNSEFKRIFTNLNLQGLEFHDTEIAAITSFTTDLPVTHSLPLGNFALSVTEIPETSD